MDLLDHCEDYEKELKNNHSSFESFGWHEAPEDREEWCVVYTSSRDSELLTQSNAHVIDEEMKPLLGDYCSQETHSHWACGYVDGYSIRCRDKDGEFSEPFKKWVELSVSLSDYGILDESHFSELEFEAAMEYIESEDDSFFELPDGWVSAVYSRLDCSYDELSSDKIHDAMNKLGFFTNKDRDDYDIEDEDYEGICAIEHLCLIFRNLYDYNCDFDLIKWYSDNVVKNLLNDGK